MDTLPIDKREKEKPSPWRAESVKPPRKRPAVQRVRKTRQDNAAKPLNANDVEGAKEDKSIHGQSSLVKPRQTSFPMESDEGLGLGTDGPTVVHYVHVVHRTEPKTVEPETAISPIAPIRPTSAAEASAEPSQTMT